MATVLLLSSRYFSPQAHIINHYIYFSTARIIIDFFDLEKWKIYLLYICIGTMIYSYIMVPERVNIYIFFIPLFVNRYYRITWNDFRSIYKGVVYSTGSYSRWRVKFVGCNILLITLIELLWKITGFLVRIYLRIFFD